MTERRWTREHLEKIYREYLGEEDDSPKSRKRARILEAATELFIKQGYRKTSVEEIARRAGVAKGTVYLYFDNKGALLTHAIAIEKKALIHVLDPILSGTIPEGQRLRFWVQKMLEVPRELPLVARLLGEDAELEAALADVDPAQLEKSHSQGQSWLVELIEMAAPGRFTEDEKRLRADILLGLRFFAGTLMNPSYRMGRAFETLVQGLADMLIWGAVNPPPEES